MLVKNLIRSVRLQLQALDETLELLEEEINSAPQGPVASEEDLSREPKCPNCGSEALNEAAAMGRPRQIACRDCGFSGDPA